MGPTGLITGRDVIDHIGFPVSDYERSKAFYDKALVPLGYVLIMEVGHAGNGDRAAGFGRAGKPEIWIGEEGGVGAVVHVAIAADDPRRSMPSTAPRSRPAAPTTARPDCGRIIRHNALKSLPKLRKSET